MLSVVAIAVSARLHGGSTGQSDPRFEWIASIEKHGGVRHLSPGTYYIDRQYVLPPNSGVVGARVNGTLATSVVAVKTKPAQASGLYHGCGSNVGNRVGFVLGNGSVVRRLRYVGFDTGRFPDSHPLCGGAPFETPGCASAYCTDNCTTGDGHGVANVLVEDVRACASRVGRFRSSRRP